MAFWAGRLVLALLLAALMMAALARFTPVHAQELVPDVTLRGALTRAQHETYIEAPFRVPRGVAAITVALSYTGRERRTVVDLGVFDPHGLRGWSGGNKDRIVIGETSATPSYRAGPIQPGRWRLLLGVPNVREGSNDSYEARIWFHRGDEPPFAQAPLRSEARWYRGDLHMHTGHSDGASTPGGPSLVSQTLDRAREASLDFIAITDHNATSAFNELRALQPAYPDLLLLPGREITTFQGHANVIGATRVIDFRVAGQRTMNDVLADAAGAFVSINHPSLPTGEGCMGCRWTAPNTDYARVQAVEIVNGGAAASLTNTAEGPLQGIAFWHGRLNEGHRLVAIGGSDNHDPARSHALYSAIGRPTTVVFARELSHDAILEGLRSGRVFIDADGAPNRRVDLAAGEARMGGVANGDIINVTVTIIGVPDARLEIIADGARIEPPAVWARNDPESFASFAYDSGGARHWLSANVRDASGRLVLISNPLFINWPPAPR